MYVFIVCKIITFDLGVIACKLYFENSHCMQFESKFLNQI